MQEEDLRRLEVESASGGTRRAEEVEVAHGEEGATLRNKRAAETNSRERRRGPNRRGMVGEEMTVRHCATRTRKASREFAEGAVSSEGSASDADG